MYKKILVPLDGSERAETVLPYVEELAQVFKAKVILLQIIELTVYQESIHGYTGAKTFDQYRRETSTQEAKTYLDGVQERLQEKGILSESFIELGPSVQTIISIAEKEDADLIAMASHGRTGLSYVFYGSVAAGILHRVDRPLLLIRAKE